MTRARSGLGPVPLPASLVGLIGVTPAAGDIQVGVVDAGGGRFQLLARGAADEVLGVGPLNTTVNWRPSPTPQPLDYGFVGWNFPPFAQAGAPVLTTAGQLALAKGRVVQATTISRVHISLSVAGATLTVGQCGGALYQKVGGIWTLLGQLVDQQAAWSTNGDKPMSLVAPVAAAKGPIYCALWYQGTTGPQLRGSNAGAQNLGDLVADIWFARANTGITTTAPATLTGIVKTGNNPFLFALEA